jgi:hypothetical protein
MNKTKKAISLINESIDLLKELKYTYARSHLEMAIKEINKNSNSLEKNKKEDKKQIFFPNPRLSLKIVEKMIQEEKQ